MLGAHLGQALISQPGGGQASGCLLPCMDFTPWGILRTFSQSRGARCGETHGRSYWSPEAETWNSNRSAWSEANWRT